MKMNKLFSRDFFCTLGIGALLAVGAQTALAQEDQKWVDTGIMHKGSVFYIDEQSVVTPEKQPNWRQVKVLIQKSDAVGSSKLVTWTLDCEKASIRDDGSDEYEQAWGKGKVLQHNDADAQGEFRGLNLYSDGAEDIAMNDLYNKVCNK